MPGPCSPPPLRTREPSALRTLERAGLRGRRLRRLPLRATAPARAAGPGRGSEGGPGPAPPARPLLLALLGPRCPACGSSGTARRRALHSSARAGREAATAPSAEAGSGTARCGAGQLRLQRGPRQDHGGRIAAEGGGGGRSALGTRRRRQRRSLLRLLLPPPPPAWEWEGASRDWLSVRAGAATAAFSSSSSAQPPTCSPAPRTRLAHTRPPPATAARLPEPQAPPTPARREAVAQERKRGCAAHARAAGHVTANGRAPGIWKGWGVGPQGRAGGSCLGGCGSGSSPPPPSRGRGWGQKVHDRTHVLSSLRRKAGDSGRSPPSFVTAGTVCQFLPGKEAGKGPNEWESEKRGGEVATPDRARRRTLLVPLCHSLMKRRAGEGRSSTYK